VLRDSNNIWTPATSIWTSLSLDQRDIFYDPSRGYYGSQRIGYYRILKLEEEHYIRTDTKLEWFITLWNLRVSDTWSFKGVFGIHTGVSFIFPQPGYKAPIIAEASQFAVDGMFIGRGWSSEYYKKGLALWENWAELRIPVVPGIFAWDFFFDAAGVRNTPWDLIHSFGEDDNSNSGRNTHFMRFSFGGGIRFSIPQFPLRFSIAKRFKITDGTVDWMGGAIGRNPNNPSSGMDLVVSFVLSSY
jgi:outer membrane protein insertion porin family